MRPDDRVGVPKASGALRSSVGDGQAFRFDAAGADAPDLGGTNQTAFFKNLEMLDNGGQRDVERLGQG